MHAQQFGTHKNFIRLLIQVGLILVTGSPAAAVTGYHITFDGELYAFDPVMEAVTLIGQTDLAGGEMTVATDLDGTLYAVRMSVFPNTPLWLHRVDPMTTESFSIGSLDAFAIPTDLTVDASGGLWMVADGDLYSINTETGTATEVGPSSAYLRSIASLDGVLYSLAGDPPEDSMLVTVDPTNAETTFVTDIDPGILAPWAMDFDRQGTLWVVNIEGGVLAPPITTSEFWQMDPTTGTAVERATYVSDAGNGLIFFSFALAAGPFDGVTEVPTLSSFGMAVLVALLAAGGVFGLRRRVTATS